MPLSVQVYCQAMYTNSQPQLCATALKAVCDKCVMLQNHIMGRLSMNSCLMAGGSTWFVRKR